MAKTTLNTKALKGLQEIVLKGKESVSKEELIALGIDTTISPQEFKNIQIKKDFFGTWYLSLIDKENDLDGNPISENKKLLQIIKAHFESNKKEINASEFWNLNIWTAKGRYKIGNFELDSVFGKAFDIFLIDKNKTVDNLWIDAVIDRNKVIDTINRFDIQQRELEKMKELDLNKKLEEHFKHYFSTVKKGGTSNKGLVDLILGDNKFGIELKLGRELKKTDQTDRAYGQAERYKEEFKDNFLLLIAGTINDKKEKALQDLLKKLKDKNILYYFIEAH